MIEKTTAVLSGVVLSALVVACGNDVAKSTRPVRPAAGIPGGTGAFAIVADGVRQKLYLPEYSPDTNTPLVAVVDVSAAGDGVRGAPALLHDVALDAGRGSDVEYATTTAGDSTIVLAASTQSPAIWFIDTAKDEVIDTLRLDASFGQSTFGGNGGYVTAVVMDPERSRAIAAVWNGFAVIDLDTRKLDHVIAAPPSENFAFDPVHQRLYAPFYDCASSLDAAGNTPEACANLAAPDGSPMTDGLAVVDLTDETVYVFQNTGADDPHAPVGTSPGGAAVDPLEDVVVVPSKLRQYQTTIDFSRATFERRAHTVTAPATILRGNGLTDVGIAPPQHVAFWEGENAADIAAARVPTLAPSRALDGGMPGSGNEGGAGERLDASQDGPAYVFGLMPPLPDGTQFTNLVSSHGLAVWPGSAASEAFGVTVSRDSRWVARVDLRSLLNLPASYHEVADVSPAVTLLDARAYAADGGTDH